MTEAQAGRWPVTAVNRPVDVLSDERFADRQFFVPVDHPVGGTVRRPGARPVPPRPMLDRSGRSPRRQPCPWTSGSTVDGRRSSASSRGPVPQLSRVRGQLRGLCGLGALRGHPDADLSENDAVYHMDAASGSAGALATLMALRRRQETGIGELIELSKSANMLNRIGERC